MGLLRVAQGATVARLFDDAETLVRERASSV